MRIVELSDSGIVNKRYTHELGGEFSLLEKMKQLGIGSPKMIYNSGLEVFDTVKKVNQDINYVNIELFRKGIIIRFKKRNKFLAALIPLHEIQ